MFNPVGGGPTAGPMNIMNALGGDPATAPSHGPMSHVMNALQGIAPNAMQTWQAARPQFSYDPSLDASQHQQRLDYRAQKADWRSQRPDMGPGGAMVGINPPAANTGIVPPPQMMPGGGVTGAPLQGNPVSQLPIQQGGVGSQLGVIGANPGTTPYGLPIY